MRYIYGLYVSVPISKLLDWLFFMLNLLSNILPSVNSRSNFSNLSVSELLLLVLSVVKIFFFMLLFTVVT